MSFAMELFNFSVIIANISQSHGDWETAMQFCSSPLGSGNSLNVSSINVSVSSDYTDRLAWIGAYGLYSSWLKMLGCFRVTDSTLSPLISRTTTLKQINVYNCYEFCGGFTYFALSNINCYCFAGDTIPTVSNGRCYPQRCSGNQEDFCGENVTTNNLVSIMIYKIDSEDFGGVEECLASMYTGIFTEDSTSYYGFRAPVVLPCNTQGLGYTYRTRLDFPASHSFRLYTLPVASWQEAVDYSYGNQFGLLEFVIFRFRLPDLTQPLTGDRYWVGFLRRHKIEYGAEIPRGLQAHCVAGRVKSKGALTLMYRFCNESLPVLCEVQNSNEITTARTKLTTSSSNPTTVRDILSSSPITIQNIIDNTGDTFVNLNLFIIIIVFAAALCILIIFGVCWIIFTIRKKRQSAKSTSTENLDNDGLYTEIESIYSVITNCDTISTTSDIQLSNVSISLPEKKKRRSTKRKEKRGLPSVPDQTLPSASSPGASRLADLPVRRKSDSNIIKGVLEMYGEDTPPTPPPTPRHSIPDVVPEGEYYILEEINNKETPRINENINVEQDDDHFYHVLERDPKTEVNTNRDVEATLRAVANRIPLSKWVGGRAASHEPSRISRVLSKREGNLDTVEEGYEVDLNKTKKALSMRGRSYGAKDTSLHPHAALKSTTSTPPLKLFYRGSSRKYKTTKQATPQFDANDYVIPLSMKKTDSMYDHMKRDRFGSTKSSNDNYETMESVRDYLETSDEKSAQENINAKE
ncbi:uncharacterized protein LOC133190675 [Saccostrea echinata]|uniref:uncharacterized protein LOC133190675 n=1 Tax=Saccostrea echinata TaxID=191078 RepID=UPI002A80D2A6|nr:uncharacterized protein LOC133190675 [Saccostrea echinata]